MTDQQTPPQYPQPTPPPAQSEQDARLYGMLCHLTALVGYIAIPFGHILGPLIVWLIKKDQYPFVDDQGKESLNFQLSLTIYAAISGVLICVLIGFVLLPAVYVFGLVMVIIASLQANQGVYYRYPLTIRFLR